MAISNREELLAYLRARFPEKTEQEREDIVDTVGHLLLDLHALLSHQAYERMKKTVDDVDRWIRELKQAKKDKQLLQFLGLLSGGGAALSALALSNPVGLILCPSFAVGCALSNMGASRANARMQKFKNKIKAAIEKDLDDFRAIARVVRLLDETFRTKLGVSLYSESDREFLQSFAEFTQRGKGSPEWNVPWDELLRRLAMMQSYATALQALNAAFFGAVVSPGVMFLNVGLQAFLFIQEIDSDKLTITELDQGLARMRRECGTLEHFY